jgi:hypothetical protein
MPEDSQNELTNAMVKRYTDLHFAGVTNAYDVMAALAEVVRRYDADQAKQANHQLIERDGGLNPT